MNRENIEKILKNIAAEDVPADVHKIAEEKSEDFSRTLTPSRQHILWSDIMKSRITKLATAVVVILIVMFGVTLLDKSATPAWAIEQTIEALKRFNTIHITGVATGDNGSEVAFNLWAKANEDQSASSDFRMELEDGKITLVKGDTTYTRHYDPNTNTLRIVRGDRASLNPWPGSDLLERLEKLTDDWTVLYGSDPATGRDRVFVTCSHTQAPGPKSWWFEFDLETKLLVNFKQWHNQYREGTPAFDAQSITYYEDLSDEIFEFEIPRDAKVIEEKSSLCDKLDDPNVGMPVEAVSQEEASVEIVRQYWQAVIDGDWALVANLRPVASEEDWQRKYSVNPPEKLLEVGQAYQQEGCSIGPVVPCTVRFEDSTTRDIKMIIKFRKIDGKSSCVIAGTWGRE